MSHTTHPPTHSGAPSAQKARRFIVHYLEMVVAMVAGMAILGPLEGLVVDAAGWTSAFDHSGVNAIAMATNMTVAMAGWMRFRGHTRAPIIEMSAAMYLPFLILLVPLWQDAITEGTFVLGGHVLMLLGMLLAMLVRLEEYTGHHEREGKPREPTRRASPGTPSSPTRESVRGH